MFLIERTKLQPVGTPGGGVEEFEVLGATANGTETYIPNENKVLV